MDYEDPRDDPNNYFTNPPLITVEQANPPERIPMADDLNYPTTTPTTGAQVGSGVASFVKGIVGLFAKPQNPQYDPYMQPPPPSDTSWMMPVAVIGGAVILLVVLKKNRRSRRSRR